MLVTNLGVYWYLNISNAGKAATVDDAIEWCGGPADGLCQEVLGFRAKQGVRRCIREGLAGIFGDDERGGDCKGARLHAPDVRHGCPPCSQ
jgi:hypothetical protein